MTSQERLIFTTLVAYHSSKFSNYHFIFMHVGHEISFSGYDSVIKQTQPSFQVGPNNHLDIILENHILFEI